FGEAVGGVASVLEGGAKSDAQAVPAEVAEQLPQTGASRGRILIIDDDPMSTRLVEGALHGAGFESSAVSDPDKAFETILQENPDLIILDVVMPRMDGFRLCQRVRAHPGMQLTPIIFVTRKDDVEQRVRGLQVGGNDYVTKPFQPQELVARVHSHLQHLAELRNLAFRDGLTRCYNNKFFKMRLEQETTRARRYEGALMVGLLDVDHFKRINDGYGHPAGDAVLAQLGSILMTSVRNTDVIAR